MKKLAAITFTSMMLLLATAMVVGAVDSVDIRGHVATGTDTWTAEDFAGFYYDIDDNIKTEEMTMTVSEGRKLVEPDGVVYTTKAMEDDFDFDEWGKFYVIGFLADKYFAGYIEDPDSNNDVLCEESDDENVLADEQLLKILVDDDDEMTVTSGTPLKLEEGYELSIKSIDIDGNKVYLELSKDGSVVDSKVISPSKDGAGMKDKTYYYYKDIGDSKEVVIVGAHFKNAFRGADQNLATIDGLWQLSDEAQDVSEDTEYDKMTIQTVTDTSITMDNEDNDITLSNDKDIALMAGVRIKVADPDADEGTDVLRYYPYKQVTIEGAETTATTEVPAVAEEKTVVETPAETVVAEENNTTAEVKEETTEVKEETATENETAEPATEEKKNETAEPAPGFESVFALTGLLAVAYLVIGRRE